MKSGRLRHKVTIQEVTETRDSYGAVTETWSTFADAYAEINPIRGSELVQSLQSAASLSHMIRMRYISGITPKMRIKFGTRIFDIESIVNAFEKDRMLEVACVEQI